MRNLNRRRMLSVFMTTIYSQLCGIGIVTAYLIDIFESSINALTLVLVSSPTFYITYSPLNFRFHSFLVESARRNPSFGVLHLISNEDTDKTFASFQPDFLLHCCDRILSADDCSRHVGQVPSMSFHLLTLFYYQGRSSWCFAPPAWASERSYLQGSSGSPPTLRA